jgi:flagellin
MSVINTNVKALVAQESMRSSNLSMSQAMERLSTGSKINSAKDDAAGLAITNRMTSQIRGMAKAIGNVNDAISMSQTAEGAIGNVGDILQRMRELAVQAGTGTMNDSDRSSLQLEVSQLKQQIDDIATKTNHNNIKLLDGTAQNVVIQSGVNSGDTVKIGFDSMKTKDIGIGSKAFLQSAGGTVADRAALAASSLYLNGVAVGASLADDDGASPATDKSASAIAKAAAINRVANLSGVYARAEATFVSGTAMSAAGAQSAGSVTINGVSTDMFSTSLDTSLSRKIVVDAINAISTQTGVVATDTGDDTLGVTLSAADGRNISLTVNGIESTSVGLKNSAATVYVGSYSLFTLDGRDIKVEQSAGTVGTDPATVEKTSGLQVGTYKADTAMYTSTNRTSTTAAPSSADAGLLNSNSLIINGVAIGAGLATDDTSTWEGLGITGADLAGGTSTTRASSAIAIAAAINRKSVQTGVTATAAENVLRGTSFTSSSAAVTSLGVFLNGVTFQVAANTVDQVIDRFNEFKDQTGVVASRFGDGMELRAKDGRTITIASDASASNQLGLTGVTIGGNVVPTAATPATAFYSSVNLSSDSAFEIKAGSNGNDNLEALGFRQGTYGASKNGLKIAQVDVSSVAGASQAITAIDSAINTVSAAQAKSGAINNRLDSIINNLTEGSKNMQASRSRILDTDYATETTNLAKQQIIQQAATAMLAQANQSSQSILSLLK